MYSLFRWLVIFFTSTSKNLGATGCDCDLAKEKSHAAFLYAWACHVFSGRTRGNGGESSARVSRRLRWHDIEHVRIRAHAHAAIGVHDIIRNKDSLLSFSRRSLWIDEVVCGLCESTRSCGAAARSSSAPGKFHERPAPKILTAKKKRGYELSVSITRWRLSNVFLFSKTPAIYGLLRSYGGSSLENSLRWQAISSWESIDLREIGVLV